MKTIIVVGFRIDTKNNYFTGQAAMIDLFIDIVSHNGYKVIPVSLNYKLGANTTVGRTSFFRIVDYFRIFIIIFFQLFLHPGCILYFSPVSNKIGFIRDAFMVRMANFFGCKIFMQQFGCRFESFYKSLTPQMQNIVNKTYRCATVITTEGVIAREQLMFLNCPDKIMIINNGLPERSAVKVTEGKKIESEKTFRLLYVNNMIESKGYLDIIKAIDILVNINKKDVKAVFAGKFMSVIDDKLFKSPKEAQDYFFDYIESHNLSKHITYYPGLYGEEKAKQFLLCNTLLLPTYFIFEGQPTVILEALSYGAVPVVTNHSLIPEMVNNDCGVFVEKGSPESIVKVIMELMDNSKEYHRLSTNSLKRYNENYTIEIYTGKILQVLSTKF